MATKIVDKILPTTMVGSYPRPQWFKQQLLGRDIRVAFKEVQHEEVYTDAVATVIRDQEEAGLDIVTDGNMWYDDYVGVIGSFCWYLYERIDGFEPSKEEHPSTRVPSATSGKAILHDWGGVMNNGPVCNSRSGSRISTRSRPSLRIGRSRSPSAPVPRTSPGTSTSSTTRTRRSSASRWRPSSTRR